MTREVILKNEVLQNFRALDVESFTALIRHLGFPAAACFLASGETAVPLIASEAVGVAWPAAFKLQGLDMPPGWSRPNDELASVAWPKAVAFYVPDQDVHPTKLIFAVVPPPGKRLRANEMHAALEATASRIRSFVEATDERLLLSDLAIREQLKTLSIDLRMLIDHELRTPLSSVAGYSALLRDGMANDAESRDQFLEIIESQTASALEMLDKLSLALYNDSQLGDQGEPLQTIDAEVELRAICDDVKRSAEEFAGPDAAAKTFFRILKSTDQPTLVEVNRKLFRWAMWEVLKNGVTHSRSGQVDVILYTSDSMLVIDVQDDGQGVAPGSEELIFLRFYQEPGSLASRKGRRGLGLGLFLARHIVERHFGRLTFIRSKGRGGLFRFLWPRIVGRGESEPAA